MKKRKKSCEEGEQISPLPHLISFMDFHTSELSKAIRFIRDVKARLFCHPDKLYSFVKVLRSSLVGSLTTTVDKDYTKKVRDILDGHDDLILRFNLHFLPPSCGTSHLTEILDYEAKKLVDEEETISDVFEVNKKGKEMVMGCGENDEGKSFKTIVEVMKGKEKMGCGENHRKKREERIEYDGEDEDGDEEGPSCRTSHLPEIVESEAKKLVDAEETVSDGFEVNKKGKEMMGCGENLRKKNEERIEYDDDENEKGDIEKGLPEQVLRLFGKVQERLSCSEKYISFLRNIYDYTKQIIDQAELVDAVSALIGQHSDLMSELNKYLKNQENVDEQPRNDARVIETRRCGERRKRRQEMDFFSKPIHELDLSKCERCTPSYRLLPEEYPISVVKGRTKLGARVLNDSWVCVPSGEVVYPSKERRRNGQEKEKSLVKLEDDIHELDSLVSRFASAKVYAKKLEEGRRGESRIGDWSEVHTVEEWNVDMVDGKEIDFLSCVKQIYGEKGEEVIDALHNDSARALPVILVRLQQKLEEVKQYRSCFHKEWADLYMLNPS